MPFEETAAALAGLLAEHVTDPVGPRFLAPPL